MQLLCHPVAISFLVFLYFCHIVVPIGMLVMYINAMIMENCMFGGRIKLAAWFKIKCK